MKNKILKLIGVVVIIGVSKYAHRYMVKYMRRFKKKNNNILENGPSDEGASTSIKSLGQLPEIQLAKRSASAPAFLHSWSKPAPVVVAPPVETIDIDQEDPNEYGPGGYHPISIGTVLNNRYEVIRKLGYGHFSTVWLCYNKSDKDYVAVKVVKCGDVFTGTAVDEICLLQYIHSEDHGDDPRSKFVVRLLEDFESKSIYGSHICMVFEVQEQSLLHLIVKTDYKGLRLDVVKEITEQALTGLQYLHDVCNIIHTDIKPENILVSCGTETVAKRAEDADRWYKKKLPKVFLANHLTTQAEGVASCSNQGIFPLEEDEEFDIQVKIGDLGNACWDEHHFTDNIQTKQYRCLEVLIGADYSYSADIWSLGCSVFEMATGEYLFNPHSTSKCSCKEEHIALISELVGKIPEYIAFSGRNSRRFFKSDGSLRNVKKLNYWPLENVLIERYAWDPATAAQFADILLGMIELDPHLRLTATDCLQHDWLSE